ncbi:hypothetical protein B0O99DRAFT_386339 [Bisporella sp. PMI_857]|nr:hypothetical protein B0O99DRAFT_386339 [Bisporella sp. PMI_857]
MRVGVVNTMVMMLTTMVFIPTSEGACMEPLPTSKTRIDIIASPPYHILKEWPKKKAYQLSMAKRHRNTSLRDNMGIETNVIFRTEYSTALEITM